MNEFSLVCRLLGTLFNRAPADPVLAPVLTMIKQGQLKAHWPLECGTGSGLSAAVY